MADTHTSGPWSIEPYSHVDKRISIPEPGIWIDYDDVDHDEQDVNARLAARAWLLPELVTALQLGVQCFSAAQDEEPAVDIMRVALKKYEEAMA